MRGRLIPPYFDRKKINEKSPDYNSDFFHSITPLFYPVLHLSRALYLRGHSNRAEGVGICARQSGGIAKICVFCIMHILFLTAEKVKFLRLFTAFLMVLVLAGCQAPHSNPLDPDNPAYRIYTISGTVADAGLSTKPTAGAMVSWPEENLHTLTGADGAFVLQCTRQKDGWLYIQKQGYAPDSVFLSWGTAKSLSTSRLLNRYPQMDSLYIYSSVRNKYSGTEYYLYFETYVSDTDDDIDTVRIACPRLNIYKTLNKINANYFEGRFSDFDLELTSFDDVIGKDFSIITVDRAGKTNQVGTSKVIRVINTEITTITPKNSDTLTTNVPLLNWTRFSPGFSFSYTVEIYTDETEPVLQWRKENLSSEEISIKVDTPLTVSPANNNFFWVIWCIDEYKNRSRSKPAGFTIE